MERATTYHSQPYVPPIIARFQRLYPEASRILAKLSHTHQGTQCFLCILGKAARSPIPKNAQPKPGSPTEPLDAVSTGSTCPISLPDTQDNQYLQLLVDLASCLLRCQPMRRKNEAPQEITPHINNLQVALAKMLKRYHSDKARELQRTDIQNMLKAQGTRTMTTAPTIPSRTAYGSVSFAPSSMPSEPRWTTAKCTCPSSLTPPKTPSIRPNTYRPIEPKAPLSLPIAPASPPALHQAVFLCFGSRASS